MKKIKTFLKNLTKKQRIILSTCSFLALIGLGIGTYAYVDNKNLENSCTVRLIKLHGDIHTSLPSDVYGQHREAMVNAVSVEDIQRKLTFRGNAKVILLNIDSARGDLVAGEAIAKIFQDLDIPTIAIIGNRASGAAYEAISSADMIFAPLGSQIAGINPESDVEISIRETFISTITANRELPRDRVARFANGSTYTAQKALDLGFVDRIGGYYDAVVYLENSVDWKVHVCKY